MYKHINVDAVFKELYSSGTKTDEERLNDFIKISNTLKLKDPDSYNQNKVFTTHGYRCYAYKTTVMPKVIKHNIFSVNGKDKIQSYVEDNEIEIDEDRYIVCVPEMFANFVLCEKFKNIKTYVKKNFLYENKLDADHVLSDGEKVYIFMRTLKESGVCGTIYMYNVEKSWYVPVLSNENSKIYAINKAAFIPERDDVEITDIRSMKYIKRPYELNAVSKNEFTELDVMHFHYAIKHIYVQTIVRGLNDKSTFTSGKNPQNDKILGNIKNLILDNMYDK